MVFEAYAGRYKTSYDIPALIPQVYLHYDPHDQRTRRGKSSGTPLVRQRMDFLAGHPWRSNRRGPAFKLNLGENGADQR